MASKEVYSAPGESGRTFPPGRAKEAVTGWGNHIRIVCENA
jgi:hypothetical protein